jgi:hypothetical protein
LAIFQTVIFIQLKSVRPDKKSSTPVDLKFPINLPSAEDSLENSSLQWFQLFSNHNTCFKSDSRDSFANTFLRSTWADTQYLSHLEMKRLQERTKNVFATFRSSSSEMTQFLSLFVGLHLLDWAQLICDQ